jgi:hypothetical protein
VTGRVHSGSARPGDAVRVLAQPQPGGAGASEQQVGGEGKDGTPREGGTAAFPSRPHKIVRITKRVGMSDVQVRVWAADMRT